MNQRSIKLSRAYRAPHAIDAHLVLDRLQAEGIDAKLLGATLEAGLGGVPLNGGAGTEIWVPRRELDRSRELLAEWNCLGQAEDQRFQFSLGLLFLFITLLAIVCGVAVRFGMAWLPFVLPVLGTVLFGWVLGKLFFRRMRPANAAHAANQPRP